MARTLRGIGVSPGVAVAPALIIRWDFPEVPDRGVRAEQVDAEVRRLREAVDHTVAALQELGERRTEVVSHPQGHEPIQDRTDGFRHQ